MYTSQEQLARVEVTNCVLQSNHTLKLSSNEHCFSMRHLMLFVHWANLRAVHQSNLGQMTVFRNAVGHVLTVRDCRDVEANMQ